MTTNDPVPTFMLILDAGRADYITPERTPFLAKLKEEGVSGQFESPPGFAQRTTMFTGTYPDTSGNFSAFGYNPSASPFQWVGKMGPLRALYQPRKIMFPARVAVKHMTKLLTGAFHTDPAWIPARFLPFFEVVEDTRPIFEEHALPHTSVFDLFREHDKRFQYLAHPVSGNDADIYQRALHAYRSGEACDFIVAQFSNTDEGGHRHGPALPDDWEPALGQNRRDQAVMENVIGEIDRKVADIDRAMEKRFGDHNILILGDHGMAPVRRRVNILTALKSLSGRVEPAKDYVVFLDSTFAKFWFMNERAEREVTGMLQELGCGRILTDQDRRDLRIAFDHRRYGDLMFAADPGVLFWPDYFHVVDSTIKGMHGYVDKREETYGAMVLHGPSAEAGKYIGVRNLVDVFETICDLTGVPVPVHNEGTSLFRAAPVRNEPVSARSGRRRESDRGAGGRSGR